MGDSTSNLSKPFQRDQKPILYNAAATLLFHENNKLTKKINLLPFSVVSLLD